MKNSQELATTIKEMAKMRNVTVGKMLSDCGLSVNTLSSMQSGGYFPRLEAINKIADYLKCSVDYLLGRTDNPDGFEHAENQTNDSIPSNNELCKFWDTFCGICEKNQTKPNTVAKAISVSSATCTKWKNGAVPNGETLLKLADYFGCSVDYLLGRTGSPNDVEPVAVSGDSLSGEMLDSFNRLTFADKAQVINLIAELSKKS